ncbi:alpha/beta hydrolase [Pseudonocardia sp. CNS-139]|nr:alpha/beta hydrolase [Pseudonocardia sp. CNS-139]
MARSSPQSVAAADGVPLHVEVDGPADAPVTVVLAHGWSLDARTWGPVAQLLAGPSRVVRYDHRGHGRSAGVDPATMTIDQLADDLAAVLAAVAPEGPLVLGGHSMGGMTLMALADRHPGLLARAAGIALVATASGGVMEQPFGLAPRQAAVYRQVEDRFYGSRRWSRRGAFGPSWALGPGLGWLLLGRGADPAARRLTVRAVAECRPQTVSGFRATLATHERDAALAAFASVPTVLLVGDRDRLTPVRAARRIAGALPSADLTIFPEAGHMLPLERAGGVADRIAGLVRAATGR